MEKYNFEKSFRNQLNSREIQPSNGAWDKLEANLNRSNKSKKPVYWIAIAASFIGFISIATFYFSPTTEKMVINKNELVNQEKHKTAPINKSELIANKTIPKGKIKIGINNSAEIDKDILIVKTNIENSFVEKQPIQIEQNQTILSNVENKTQMVNIVTPSEKIEISNPTITVNPKNLLSQVEDELKLTFRQKVLKTIVKNYKATKEILVVRNQE